MDAPPFLAARLDRGAAPLAVGDVRPNRDATARAPDREVADGLDRLGVLEEAESLVPVDVRLADLLDGELVPLDHRPRRALPFEVRLDVRVQLGPELAHRLT